MALSVGLPSRVRRPPPPNGLLGTAAQGLVLLGLALLTARYGAGNPALAVAPAGLALVAIALRRRQAGTLVVLLVMTGTYGSLEIYTGLPVGPLVDLALAGLWLGAIWRWTIGGVDAPGLNPALWVLALLLLVNAVYVLMADDVEQGLYGYRVMSWYMLAGLLAALVLTRRAQQRTVLRGFLLAALLCGGYAMVRWATGPGAEELAIAKTGGAFVLNTDQEIRPFGALLTPGLLGTWGALGACAAGALALLVPRPGFRLLAVAAMAVCVASQFAAQNRIPIVATAVGAAGVLALFAVSRGGSGRKVLPLSVGVGLFATAAIAFAAIGLSDDKSRFSGLLNIENDASYQERVQKWKSFLSDMPAHPFGHGIGSTGAAQLRYNEYRTVAAFAPDSGYVKVAYDQGYAVMGLFIATMLALLLGLAIRAVGTADPWDAARALAGFGALLALVVMMGAGEVNEGLPGLAVWLLVGVGLAPVAVRDAE